MGLGWENMVRGKDWVERQWNYGGCGGKGQIGEGR